MALFLPCCISQDDTTPGIGDSREADCTVHENIRAQGARLLSRLGYVHAAIINGSKAMKRFIASVVLAIALLTSGAMVTPYNLGGTAYAADGGGGE